MHAPPEMPEMGNVPIKPGEGPVKTLGIPGSGG